LGICVIGSRTDNPGIIGISTASILIVAMAIGIGK